MYTLPALPERAPVAADGDQPPPPANKVTRGELTTELQDLTGVRIMWDAYHGQGEPWDWVNMIDDLELRGAEVVVNTVPITAELLAEFDIFWTIDCSSYWVATETAALGAWLRAGGGLLLEGDNSSTVVAYNAILTAASAGIVYTAYSAYEGITTQIFPHETTVDVASLYLNSPIAHLSTIVSPAQVLVRDVTSVPVGAWSEAGSGRVMALSDEYFYYGALDYEDNRLFGNQVFDWLAGASWLQVEPTSGVVPAGTSQAVTVTFDATDLCGGEFAAQVAVTSNDPITPEVSVPASLDVIGESDITVTPASLAYGPQYIGAVVPDTLTVTNDGCELLTVSSLTSDNLEFTALPAGPFTLAPDATQVVVVTYAPATVGPVAAVLTIASDDPDEPAITVSLSGTGVPPPVITVTPASLSSTLYPGGVEIQTLTIGNVGQSDLVWSAAIQPGATLQTYTLPALPERAPVVLDEDRPASTRGPVSSPALTAELNDLTDVRILWVRAHGENGAYNWSDLISDLEARGAELVESFEPVTTTLLTGFDIAYVNYGYFEWSTAEIAALTAWLQDGGGLMLESNDYYIYNPILSAAGAGITYGSGYSYEGVSTLIHPHEVTAGVSSLYMGFSYANLSTVVAPAGLLAQGTVGQMAWPGARSGRAESSRFRIPCCLTAFLPWRATGCSVTRPSTGWRGPTGCRSNRPPVWYRLEPARPSR